MIIGTTIKGVYDYFSKQDKNNEYVLLETVDDEKIIGCEMLISRPIKPNLLTHVKNLKYFMIPFTGLESVDVAGFKDKGITVLNTHGHSHFVAEKALALAMALLGNVVNYNNDLKVGNWSNRTNEKRVNWISLYNLNVGIYGYGHIGKNIEKLLKPFNVKVHVIDRGKTYSKEVNLVSDIEQLVAKTDILFVATPLNEYTKNSITKNVLEKMSDKYIVNVGRGKVINEEDLYNALRDGTLGGFASDVWYNYPKDSTPTMPSNFDITSFFNVVVSPHCAGAVKESMYCRYDEMIETINEIGL